MKLTLEIWRQAGPQAAGHFEYHTMEGLDGSMSILELLDRLNETLVNSGKEPFTFESDCREGICGACGIQVSGTPHGPERNTPACHQRLRSFRDGSWCGSSRCARRATPCCATSWLIATSSTKFSRPAPTSLSTLVQLPTPTRCLSTT